MPRNTSSKSQPQPQLLPLPVANPGSLGLSLRSQQAVQDPRYCIEALNCVIDQYGRVAARQGRTTVTSSAAAGQVRSIFEYRTATGASLPIVAFDGGISSSLTAPSGSSLVGTISSVANGRWYFQNFLGNCIGFQAGQKPIVLTSPAGTFSNIVEASGSAPQGGVGCAAYGRLWGMNADGHTLQWCALGDYTNWTAGDAGSIDLHKVWPQGMDQVTAVFAFAGCLVICGLKQILLYGCQNPTVLGLDVTSLKIVDTVEGCGCISQWTVATAGGEIEDSDVLFCSSIGIQSLQRLIQASGNHPIQNFTKTVRDQIVTMLASETSSAVSGYYSQTNGYYALSLPVSGYTWIADQRHIYQDEDGDQVARITRWPFAPTALVEFTNRNNYFASATVGKIQQYVAGSDDNVSFPVTLQLPWMDLGQDYASRLKALKRVGGLIYALNSTSVTFTWFVDFAQTGLSASGNVAGGTPAQWGSSQWGIDQWGGGGVLTLLNVNASGTGQYFSLQISASSDSHFAIQQANLLAKILRLA